MVGTSSSSSSSCASFGSFDDAAAVQPAGSIKFLCSYGGKILPRHTDGRLRYVGGHTRILAVDRSISFSELQVKLRALCGWGAVSLRCQLPTEDMDDALVSVTSDEDLANLVEEYGLASRDRPSPLKIRAFLFLLPPPSLSSSSSKPSIKPISAGPPPVAAAKRRIHVQVSVLGRFHSRYEKTVASAATADHRLHGHQHHHHHHLGHSNHLVHHGRHWK